MTPQPEKKMLTEDVGGMFGFRVVWEYDDYTSSADVYKITSHEMGLALFQAADRPDLRVADVAQAEPYMHAFITNDGCVDADQGNIHWCGANDVKMHLALLKYLYCRAMALMNSTEDPWTADDKKLPEMKA